MSTPSIATQRVPAALTTVPRWTPPPGGRALLERVLVGLRSSSELDLIYDALDQALGENAPSANEIPGLTHCLRSALEANVVAVTQVVGLPDPAVTELTERAARALAETSPADPTAALGHLRRVALAAQDVLDALVEGVE